MRNRPSADNRLVHWKAWWDIYDPDVHCRYCSGRQPIDESYLSFYPHHTPGCARSSDLPQFPWQELVRILKDWKTEVGRAPRNS